jgi:site-specific DNA recombinase
MPKGYFSYIRVSTVRQGQTGTSLAEQREAIQRYADRWRLRVVREFEEKETAAKSGRPIFLEMLGALKRGQADGVIIHKIDRGARNLRDWAELGEFIDRGLDVHFANENLDLVSRGGRLSADIQAVVAADYIRNLREEVKKGFYGRLKQGFYPMPAPIGYSDQGAAKAKAHDPARAPLVRTAFELYSSEGLSINQLVEEMYARGLRTRTGKKVTKNSMAHLLHNPFYMGLIKVGKNGELFTGQHRAIVPKPLFDRVQLVLQGKTPKQENRLEFVFRRLVNCGACQATLIAERQKGFVYYRCHSRACEQKTIREESVDAALTAVLQSVCFTDVENRYLRQEVGKHYGGLVELQESHHQALSLQLEQLKNRLSNLTDAYVDGVVDKETYIEKKNRLIVDEQAFKERLARIGSDDSSVQQVEEILELANNAYLSYKMGIAAEKREMVESVTSNLSVKDKIVSIKLNFPFQLIANRYSGLNGGPQRDTARTLSALVRQLFKYFASRKDKAILGGA